MFGKPGLTSLSLITMIGLWSLALEVQITYASPYTDIDVETAHNMIINGSYPNLVVLDVRTQSEYESGHIYNAAWIPHTELKARIGELSGHKNHEIIVYCRSGVRSQNASETLDSLNFTRIYNMLGGIEAWKFADYPVWIATVHNVDTTFGYDTIQAAIDAPQTSDGHRIFVGEGTYYEHLSINKSLSLIGENRSKTIIDGNLTGHVVQVSADNTVISGFTIRRSGCGCAAKSAVYVERYRQNVSVTNNLIIQNGYGVMAEQTQNNTIAFNNITNNAYEGISLSLSSRNTVFGNTLINNSDGIGIYGLSSSNTISGNTLRDNIRGVVIYLASNNKIYHNNLIDNTQHALSQGSGYSNIWDDGYPTGGNYWSGYAATDLYNGSNQNETGSDGIGDAPYIISQDNADDYPLMGPITLFNAGTWGDVTYYVHVITNSTVSDFDFDPNEFSKYFSFNVTESLDTKGFCRVAFAEALLRGPYIIFVDGTQVIPTGMSNGTHAFLHFTYNHSTRTVTIIGTEVIPEFPSFFIASFFMIATLLAVILYRRKHPMYHR